MNWKMSTKRTFLNVVGAIILVVGLSSAVIIYKSAGKEAYGAWGYGVTEGTIYPIMPGDSKMYRHNLEVMGGKLNVMMDDFSRWFGGLWQGRSLAVVIGCTSIMISFGLFYAAHYLPERLASEVRSENESVGND